MKQKMYIIGILYKFVNLSATETRSGRNMSLMKRNRRPQDHSWNSRKDNYDLQIAPWTLECLVHWAIKPHWVVSVHKKGSEPLDLEGLVISAKMSAYNWIQKWTIWVVLVNNRIPYLWKSCIRMVTLETLQVVARYYFKVVKNYLHKSCTIWIQVHAI